MIILKSEPKPDDRKERGGGDRDTHGRTKDRRRRGGGSDRTNV